MGMSSENLVKAFYLEDFRPGLHFVTGLMFSLAYYKFQMRKYIRRTKKGISFLKDPENELPCINPHEG